MRVYLDHAATTPVDEEVLEEMLPYFTQKYGNASSLHSFGREARDAIERSREKVASLIGWRDRKRQYSDKGNCFS